MYLREIACARAGDKGNTSNVVVVPYDEDNYELLKNKLTEVSVKDYFGPLVRGAVHRYEMPGIRALNFVMEDALGGGVTRSVWMDAHGKSRASLILTMEIGDNLSQVEAAAR
ncbi:MAG TPA: hypothetical protein VHU85_15465 [Acidimicrobiales bacterium]|jgi:hypothetical protein|nr:hypothetical protein [Acidimicrobiales bacterium]